MYKIWQQTVFYLENVFFRVPHRFYLIRKDPLSGAFGEVSWFPVVPGRLVWELEIPDDDFCTMSDGIFIRILAHIYLDNEEREEWYCIKGHGSVKRQWLFGRACIKEAVRQWIFRESAHLIYPSEITVLHDEYGAPFVDGWWNGEVVPAPSVSLSHDRLKCVSVVGSTDVRVGVDMEHKGRFKKSDLLEAVLSDRERTFLSSFDDGPDAVEKMLCIWCAKEAAAKYIGLGMQGRPELFEVKMNRSWDEGIVYFNDTAIKVRCACTGGEVIALACDKN
jgi:phosphopantetheinyl transferase (holo-ACP synthase)